MRKLLPLALGTFAIGTDGFVTAALLPNIGNDLHVTVSAAGQMVTVFAIAYAVLSPVLSVTLGRRPRRQVMLGALALFTLANLGCAIAPTFGVLIAVRVLAAAGAGLFTPNASSTAAVLVAPEKRGRALALVFGGLTVANVLGVPLGALIGAHYGWRATLVFVAALGALAMAGVAVWLRDLPEPMVIPLRARVRLLGNRTIVTALLVTVAGLTGGFTLYTYIAPVLNNSAGITSAQLPLFLLASGVLGILGGQLGGRWSDRFGTDRALTVSLVAMAVALLVFPLLDVSYPGALVGLALYGVTSTATTVPNQHRLTRLAPDAPTVVLSLNSSALYVGIALAGGLGGLVLSTLGPRAIGYVSGVLVLIALGFQAMSYLSYRASQARLNSPQPTESAAS